ncbi:hypothetical protein RMN57_27220 [Kitasatospora sp. CM 4170]|uniref:Uncharacterized protein n=1 Tax=Kitasatospora aburaviensis TaxID=67265 RepID=A0ABW1EW85_9ACTN|nr:hypothetical protein [Kitasatospora sp. CM 4170]WNM48115.1 hypothetical protein RMN57_27220 [Kitasatospora sp. CM 4170]
MCARFPPPEVAVAVGLAGAVGAPPGAEAEGEADGLPEAPGVGRRARGTAPHRARPRPKIACKAAYD